MSSAKEYYEEFWNRDSDVSDDDVTTPERRKRLSETLRANLAPGDPVIDLGCGAGQFTALIESLGYTARGFDISENALRLARTKHPRIQFDLLGSNGAIPIESESVGALWSTEVIEHVLDVRFYLQEVNRVLRDGGVFIFTTPYHALLKNLLVCLLNFDGHFDPEGAHIRFFSRRGLRKVLEKAGFSIEVLFGIGRIPFLHRTWWGVCRKRKV